LKIDDRELFHPSMQRRTFLRAAMAGTVIIGLGGAAYVLADDEEERRAREEKRSDGKPRLPPGQYLLKQLRPMGGDEGDPSPGAFRLAVSGEVENPFTLDFAGLLAMPQVDQECDVHCVTKWTVLGAKWTGVRIADIAARAKLKDTARYAIMEAANGYTANMPLRYALKDTSLVAHRLDGEAIPRPHGPPVRALIPDLYFWKSAKWLTGIRFTANDEPGYWEVRGYHNRGDPWREERYG
jgi:DMSO/TMAO reductase YedYZ molybdopterin-dependent catalytic subunit